MEYNINIFQAQTEYIAWDMAAYHMSQDAKLGTCIHYTWIGNLSAKNLDVQNLAKLQRNSKCKTQYLVATRFDDYASNSKHVSVLAIATDRCFNNSSSS